MTIFFLEKVHNYFMENITTEVKDKGFVVTLGGRGHEVSSDTLILTLFSTTSILQEINKELSPDKRIEVKIKALNEGSFEIIHSLKEVAIGFLKPESIAYLSGLFGIFVGVIELRKFLKGEEPKSTSAVDTGVKVENVDGDVTIFDQKIVNIYQDNQMINDLLSRQFEKLNTDESVEYYSIRKDTDKNAEVVFEANRNDFVNLQNKRIVSKESVRENIRQQIYLKIIKLVWNDDNKWAFLYDGNKISAFIKDPDFFVKIDDGEQFAKGDELVVDLKIYQIFDQSINGYINQDYEIITVHKHIPRNEQLKFGKQF